MSRFTTRQGYTQSRPFSLLWVRFDAQFLLVSIYFEPGPVIGVGIGFDIEAEDNNQPKGAAKAERRREIALCEKPVKGWTIGSFDTGCFFHSSHPE